MKHLLFATILLSFTSIFTNTYASPYSPEQFGSAAIDQQDTVFFDLFHATHVGNFIEVPVFTNSDDVINSLDYAVKFNHLKLRYDGTVVHRASISPLSNYNSNDSTLRLTSYDLQPIPNDTILVAIRFELLTGAQTLKEDFTSLVALLNGEPCAEYVIVSGTSSVEDIFENTLTLNISPNPGNDVLNITTGSTGHIQILNMDGEQVTSDIPVYADQSKSIDVSSLPAGAYIIKALSAGGMQGKKILITRP